MKKELLKDIDLYFITDSKYTKKDVISDVRAAVNGGVKIVQYREKNKDVPDMIKEAREIKDICGNRALFIINDYVEIALAVNADGVHIGKSKNDPDYNIARRTLGSDKIIGVTVNNVEEAIEAEKLGADYLGVSPIFDTSTKPDAGEPAGVGLIEKIKEVVSIPFVAIGGIHDHNLDKVLEAGASKVAMITEIVAKDDVEKQVRYFRDRINNYGK